MVSKKFISVAAMVFAALGLWAADYSVKGYVYDAEGEPEAYATTRVFAQSDSLHAAALGITDDLGAFDLPLKNAGKYRLLISSVGKKTLSMDFSVDAAHPVMDFNKLLITDNAEQLAEVEVVAQKPLVSKEIDRIGYDVQADEDSKTSNVQDILRKVPMVTVDADGTIKVKGSTNFKIYKNGRPNNAFTSNAKDIFAAIPASMIKKIEVITDPGAKEDAEGVGAILNIETVDNSSLNGFMGNVSAQFVSVNDTPVGTLWFTGNIGKLVMSANVGYFHQGKKAFHQLQESEYEYKDSGNRKHDTSESRSKSDFVFWGVDGSYELDSLNLFTLEVGGFFHKSKSWSDSFTEMIAPDASPIFNYRTDMYTPRSRFHDIHGNFNYQRLTRRKGETITLSYQISNNQNKSLSESSYYDTFNFPAPYEGIVNDGNSKFLEQTFQADWTRPFNDHHKLSVGAKLILRDNRSENLMQYIGEDDTAREFKHNTNVCAGYFDYQFKTGRFNARAGVRYEYSRLAAKFLDGSEPDFHSNLNDWVPNASVMYNLSDVSTLKASFTTRINRPGINYLNPNKVYSPTGVSYGNPELESIHHNSIGLNYSLMKQKFNIDASVTYEFADNVITQLTEADATGFQTSTYANAGRRRNVDFSLFGQWTVTPKTTLMLNAGVDYLHLSVPSPYLANHHWGVNLFFRATQQLPWRLRLEGMMFYGSGSLDNLYSYAYGNSRSIWHGFSLQRSFLKEDRLTVKLQANNPFNAKGAQFGTKTNRGDFTGWMTETFTSARHFGISISYRFGSMKAAVKKTAASISNDDLEGASSAPSSTIGGKSGSPSM